MTDSARGVILSHSHIKQTTVPIFTGETSFIYSMYKEEREEVKTLLKQNGILEERIRQLEDDNRLLRDQVVTELNLNTKL